MKKAISIIIVVLFIVSLFCNIFQYNSNKELRILIQENDSKTGLLENSLAEKETELKEANTNITELEATVSELQSHIEEIKKQSEETERQYKEELEAKEKAEQKAEKTETKVVEQQPAAPTNIETFDVTALGDDEVIGANPFEQGGQVSLEGASGDFAGVKIY